jgi:DNA-binding NarL/FixJ family response regulator
MLPARLADGSGRNVVWPTATRIERRGKQDPTRLHNAPPDRTALTRATLEARNALREAAAAAATAAVRAGSLAEALDEALAGLPDPKTTAAGVMPLAMDSRTGVVALSPREREVLALVVEGRTNKAIAEALYVSPNTVKTHVASLLHKFDAGSRARLAALVAGQSLR